jgi:phage gp36-like protein
VKQLCGQICIYTDKESRIKITEYRNKYEENLEYQEDVKTDKLKGIDHMKKKVGCPK